MAGSTHVPERLIQILRSSVDERPGFFPPTEVFIKSAVRDRIAAYETSARPEANELRAWEELSFRPLVDRLAETASLRVLAWEDCIGAVSSAQPEAGADLRSFYERCLALAGAAER